MRETGIVKSVEGELCICSTKRKSACGDNCATCKAVCSSREHIFTAKNTIGASAGDEVIIEMPTGVVLSWTALVYILPLGVFIGVLGHFLKIGNDEISSAFWGVVAGGLSWLLVSLCSKRKKAELIPEIVEIVEK